MAAAVVNTNRVISSVFRRRALTAVACELRKRTIYFIIFYFCKHKVNSLVTQRLLEIVCKRLPVQEDLPLQVALMGSWHLVPACINWQFLQHGLFLSLREHKLIHCLSIYFLRFDKQMNFTWLSCNLPALSTFFELAVCGAAVVITEVE